MISSRQTGNFTPIGGQGEKMNLKEALKLSHGSIPDRLRSDIFLEAVDKFKPVVEALDVFVEVGYDRSKAVKILRYYRREVLGEE